MKVLETMMNTFLISILEFATVSKIELVILHLLHHFLLILPIRLDLFQFYRRLLTLNSLQHFLVLQANCLLLPFTIRHVQALVPSRSLLSSLCYWLCFLLTNPIDLIEQQFVIMVNLAISILSHANTLAMVDKDGISVLHQPSSDRFDILQVEQVMCISDLDLLELD